MRDGLRFSVALNEFVVAAVCITVIACTIGYLRTHAPQPMAAAAPVACVVPTPPTIIVTVNVPPPTVIQEVASVPEPPPQPDEESAPVVNPQHEVIITDALRQPMTIARN